MHSATLTNVCLEPFVHGVSSGAVTADGYCASNLVSTDCSVRNRGFRVEHYIRPPVTIEVIFHVPVSISAILLCPDLPQHAEMGIELSGSATRDHLAQHRLTRGPLVATSGAILLINCQQQLDRNVLEEITPWPEMARSVHGSYSSDTSEKLAVIKCFLKRTGIFHQLRCLQLKVVRWSGPKPVTLKWMEVWGGLGWSCSKQEASLFQSKAALLCSPMHTSLPPKMFCEGGGLRQVSEDAGTSAEKPTDEVEPSSGDTASPADKQNEIPERLLDALTFEVMVLPMLLPSGYTVDQSSLDKLAERDVAHGRPPTDPFTGITHYAECGNEM